MSFTLCSSGAIIAKAGAGVNSNAAASNALLSNWADQAEGYLNAATKADWISNYASVGANFKPILAKAVSALAAIDLIQYDMTGYQSTTQAQTQMNVLKDEANESIKILQDADTRKRMGI